MVNVCHREVHGRNYDLQQAFFNGAAYVSWENVWGWWNGIVPRDGEALRRCAAIERALGKQLSSPQWEPYMQHRAIRDLCQQVAGGACGCVDPGQSQSLPCLRTAVGHHAAMPGAHFYDLWHGLELSPESTGSSAALSFAIEADGFGAVLETDAPLSKPMLDLLQQMQQAKPLESYSASWQTLPQTHGADGSSPWPGTTAANMIPIPAGDYVFRVAGLEIEGNNEEGVDVQYPWESSARRFHTQQMHIAPFRIDRYPVSNAEFKEFMTATSYHPADDHNFLRDWKDGTYPAGWAKKPVTWVSIEDARAYAKWAGKTAAP